MQLKVKILILHQLYLKGIKNNINDFLLSFFMALYK
jgi:hypothetical protein